jgi:hypothetical protein
MSLTLPCERRAAKWSEPNLWPRCMSRVASTTSALFRRWKTRCAGFTPDLDRKTAGFSPIESTLVWALTDLLVEPMPGEAILEYYRRRGREAAEKKAAEAAVERHPAL